MASRINLSSLSRLRARFACRTRNKQVERISLFVTDNRPNSIARAMPSKPTECERHWLYYSTSYKFLEILRDSIRFHSIKFYSHTCFRKFNDCLAIGAQNFIEIRFNSTLVMCISVFIHIFSNNKMLWSCCAWAIY